MKRIISLVLTIVMIFSFASVAGAANVYDEDVFETVFNATKLLEASYAEDAKITYGELADAAINAYTDDLVSFYSALGQTQPFEHENALAFFVVARDVLNKTLLLQIDNPYMTVGDAKREIDPGIGTKPIIDPLAGRTLLPVRAVVEEMNGNVLWNNDTREVTLIKGATTIVLKIDSDIAYLNGAETKLDCAPVIKDGRTLLPIRFIAESFGYEVSWNPQDKTIPITRKTPVELTVEEVNKFATVGDAVDVLTYYLEKRNNYSVSFNKGTILEGVSKSDEITHKQFAQLLCELDDIAPILLKAEITKDKKVTYLPVKIEKDLDKYPDNAADFRAVLEDIPTVTYQKGIILPAGYKAAASYDSIKGQNHIFTSMLAPWAEAASTQAGVDMKITYYPVFNSENGVSNTIKVRVDIISAPSKPLVSDIFQTANGEVTTGFYFETGKSYFCTFVTNASIEDIVANINNLEALSKNLTIINLERI